MHNVEITDKGAVYIDGTRITGRNTKWGVHNIVCTLRKISSDQVRQAVNDAGYSHIKFDPEYCKEFGIDAL